MRIAAMACWAAAALLAAACERESRPFRDLAVLMFTRHAEPKRLVDVSENALFWNFIVLGWIPIYLVIYFGPRWL